ncbi:MAG: hypothetical protein JSU93_06275 [Methanobacteriota archaeon]|nr:MAG: hypothetical protein JSU93_06275 [Euryarchaeota archaeon]
MKSKDTGSEPCCPKFDPAPWEGRTHDWTDKLFIKDSVRQILHRPLPSSMKKTIGRMWKMANDAGAAPVSDDFLLLAYDPTPWRSELYMAVTKEVSGAENFRLSGTYITKVFDGPYNSPPKWIRDMDRFVESKGRKVKKYFFYFTTCPRCAKIYGHNYAVVFAQVD